MGDKTGLSEGNLICFSSQFIIFASYWWSLDLCFFEMLKYPMAYLIIISSRWLESLKYIWNWTILKRSNILIDLLIDLYKIQFFLTFIVFRINNNLNQIFILNSGVLSDNSRGSMSDFFVPAFTNLQTTFKAADSR